jgi:hypothetical protein
MSSYLPVTLSWYVSLPSLFPSGMAVSQLAESLLLWSGAILVGNITSQFDFN